MAVLDWCKFKMTLKACRAQRGFSQKDVADFVGVSTRAVVDWENGYSTPRMDKAQRLSHLYDIPMSHIDFSKEGNSYRVPEAVQ